MESQSGFTKYSIDEFEIWISKLKVARTVLYLQQHHTYSPHYGLFNQSNHFKLQEAMRNYHVNENGWADIGQHFTIFPDGSIMTGRSLEKSPACIFQNNANSICIENLGNFDTGGDQMTPVQQESIVRATAAMCQKYSVPVTTDYVVYHHWFNQSTGARNNGSGGNKSCPGTNFFGGNKVEDCRNHFLPLVSAALTETIVIDTSTILKYACVTTAQLNIRKQPVYTADLVSDRDPATLGAIIRVYKIQNGWYKISSSKNHWVSGRYTADVVPGLVNADILNVRNGPGASFLKIGSYLKGTLVFVYEEVNGWCKISMEEKWVSRAFLDLQE